MSTTDTIQVIAALGTLAAVLVALFQERIKRWWLRPKIDVEASIARFPVFTGPGRPYMPHAYLRLRVAVEEGRGGAKQVQAYILTCSPSPVVGSSEALKDEEILIPVPWSFTDQLIVDIPPGSARYVDIAEARADTNTTTRLSTVRTPPEAQHLLLPADAAYRIEVLLSADNIRPVRYVVRLRVASGWDGTAEHLSETLYIAGQSRVGERSVRG